MFTDRMRDIFLRVLYITNRLGFIQYKLDPKRGKLYVDPVSTARFFHNTSWVAAYALISLPTHLYELNKRNQTEGFNFTLIAFFTCALMSIILVAFSFKTQVICQLINCFLKLLSDFGDKYMLSGYSALTCRLIELTLLGCYFAGVIVGLLLGLDCLIRPQTPAYPLFAADPNFVSWPVKLLCSVWVGGFALGMTSLLSLCGCILIIGFYFLLQIIGSELRTGLLCYKSSSQLRQIPKHLIVTWRSVQLLIQIINVEICFILVYFDGALIFLIVSTIVALVFQWDTLSILRKASIFGIAIMCVVGWSLVLTFSGMIHSYSKKTIESWKYHVWRGSSYRKYMQKVKLACSPINIGDGSRFKIRPITTPIFLFSVSNYCFTALITYREIVVN